MCHHTTPLCRPVQPSNPNHFPRPDARPAPPGTNGVPDLSRGPPSASRITKTTDFYLLSDTRLHTQRVMFYNHNFTRIPVYVSKLHVTGVTKVQQLASQTRLVSYRDRKTFSPTTFSVQYQYTCRSIYLFNLSLQKTYRVFGIIFKNVINFLFKCIFPLFFHI